VYRSTVLEGAWKLTKEPTAQAGVRLPIAMLERLKESELGVSEGIRQAIERVQAQDAMAPVVEAAAKNGRTIAAEIEHRLARTFAEDAFDPLTRELASGVVNLAADVQRDLGAPWHEYGEVHSVFAAALAERLAAYKPTRQTSAFAQLARDMGFSGSAASQLPQAPDVLGAMIERADRRAHSYQHLEQSQAARQRTRRLRKPKDKD
jgi:hypothetical protein